MFKLLLPAIEIHWEQLSELQMIQIPNWPKPAMKEDWLSEENRCSK